MMLTERNLVFNLSGVSNYEPLLGDSLVIVDNKVFNSNIWEL